MSTSTEELEKLYDVGAGAKIQTVCHRQPTMSTTSSSASVDVNAGSTVALLHAQKKKKKGILEGYSTNNNGTVSLLPTTTVVPAILENVRKIKPKKIEEECEEVTYKLSYYRSNYLPVILASLTVSLGSCAVGFSTAYTAPALPSMNSTGLPITATEASWIGSLMPFSALIGGILGGPMIEAIGRRTTILSTALPFTISFLLIAFAQSVLTVMSGRVLSGFCVGICSLALPVYLGETVQPEVRGTLGLLPTTFGNVGILLCYAAGKYLSWRWLAILGAGIPVPFLICMFMIPETPQWYINKNQQKKARKALQWLRGADADITQEFSEIEKSNLASKTQEAPTFTSIFNRMYIKPLTISLGLMLFQQMSGINAFMFYTVQIFQESGSKIDSNLSTIIVGLVNFFATFMATVLIDRLGRKVLLMISSVTMLITLITLGGYFHCKSIGIDMTQYGWMPLLSFVTFVLGFSIGYGPIPWLMMGEILPARIRGSAASLATSFNWACTFGVTKTFISLKEWIGFAGAFWLFAVTVVIGIFFVLFCVPETQGRSLEDIEKNLTGRGSKVPVRQVRRMSSIAHLKPLPMSV